MKNNVISIRNTSLYWSQPSSVVFACKTATFGLELQVSMGPRLRLLICASEIAQLALEILISMGPSPHLWFLHAKTAPFGQEIQVSLGPRLRLVICACKTT